MDRCKCGVVVGVLVGLGLCQSASAVLRFVPLDYATIQGAIDVSDNGDVVVVSDGTYAELLDFGGKAITVQSTGGAAVTTLSGALSGSVATLTNGEGPDSRLIGFNITLGSNTAGGGVRIENSSPTIKDCIFTANNAFENEGGGGGSGGAIFVSNGNPSIEGCGFTNNTAAVRGGAIRVEAGSAPAILDCVFQINSAGIGGGAVSCDNSLATILRSTFSSNTAPNSGGAMSLTTASNAQIENCMFDGNTTAGSGGVIANSQSSPVVINSAFTANEANNGAAIFNSSSSNPNVLNCTMQGNIGGNTAGIHSSGNSAPIVTNTIIWGNSGPSFGGAGTTTVTYSNIAGGASGSSNIDSDPLYVDAPGGMLQLSAGSPSIDAGISVAAPNDLDGGTRIVDDPDTTDTGLGFPDVIDMGAYEVGGNDNPPCPSDTNGDGLVNTVDLTNVILDWGDCDGSK